MTPILAYIQPFDMVTNNRTHIRVGDAAQADAYGLGGVLWVPAITERPVISLELMSPDLDGKVLAGRSRISLNTKALGIEGRPIKWDGASAVIYSAAALAWPAVTEFDGYVVDVSEDPDNNLVTLTLQVSTDFLEGPLLVGEFTGGGGLLGEAAARGVLYPAGFGVCENIEPIWFDTTTWIGMIDGYANTMTIDRLMEGLDDRGPAVANYANYAALKNAIDTGAIKPGQWGKCIAQGLVGLGAPPVAPIGVNATFAHGILGAMMKRILTVHRGVALGDIDTAAFDAMDVAVPRTAHYWTNEQRDVKDLIEAMASNLNATPLVTFQKKVTITRGVAAAASAELNRSGRTTPRVIDSRPAGVQKPVYRLRARAARPANVLSFDQVLYEDTIEDKGLYSNVEVYRSGHVVWLPDKSSWIYVNATPGAGNAPPAWPITSNAYWENMTPPATASDLTYADGTPIENLKPAQAGANVTQTNTAAGITGQGPGATAPAGDVLNYVDTSGGGNGMTIIRAPLNGFFADEGTKTGVIKIALPQNYSDTMIRFAVDIFDYQTGASCTYLISGYTWPTTSATNGQWVNVAVQFIGPETKSKRVRFGYDGSKCCVWIGETSSSWQYPKVFVRDVILGYAGQAAANWKSGWVVSLNTTAPSNTGTSYGVAEVAKPRPGDAVMGESIFESASGATATLANFKTALGVASAIVGQGALATLNQVDMSTTQVLPRGSAPPTLANNGFTYTSNTNSITVSWPTMTVYRSDASTISISSGSQAITGLSAGTTYRIYPFIADTGGSSATMDFVTGVSPAFGSPGILYSNSSPNVAAASQMYYYNRIPMGNFALATTSSGGGGGGGGGGWNCLHEDMLLCQRPAGETEEGTAVATPEHMGCSLAIIARVERHYCSRWIEIYSGEEMIAKVTERHLFYRAVDMSPVAAQDVRLGDLLRAEGDHVEVTGLRLCTRPATAIGIDIGEPHLHYAGPRRLVCHNGTAKP